MVSDPGPRLDVNGHVLIFSDTFVRLDTRFIGIGYGGAGCTHLEYVNWCMRSLLCVRIPTLTIYPKKAGKDRGVKEQHTTRNRRVVVKCIIMQQYEVFHHPSLLFIKYMNTRTLKSHQHFPPRKLAMQPSEITLRSQPF